MMTMAEPLLALAAQEIEVGFSCAGGILGVRNNNKTNTNNNTDKDEAAPIR